MCDCASSLQLSVAQVALGGVCNQPNTDCIEVEAPCHPVKWVWHLGCLDLQSPPKLISWHARDRFRPEVKWRGWQWLNKIKKSNESKSVCQNFFTWLDEEWKVTYPGFLLSEYKLIYSKASWRNSVFAWWLCLRQIFFRLCAEQWHGVVWDSLVTLAGSSSFLVFSRGDVNDTPRVLLASSGLW